MLVKYDIFNNFKLFFDILRNGWDIFFAFDQELSDIFQNKHFNNFVLNKIPVKILFFEHLFYLIILVEMEHMLEKQLMKLLQRNKSLQDGFVEILGHNEERLNFLGAVFEALIMELVLDDEDDFLAGLTEGEVSGDDFFHNDEGLELELLSWELMRGWVGEY